MMFLSTVYWNLRVLSSIRRNKIDLLLDVAFSIEELSNQNVTFVRIESNYCERDKIQIKPI